jgi:hypothetical protein
VEYYERAMSLFRWLELREEKEQPAEPSQPSAEELTSQSEISE